MHEIINIGKELLKIIIGAALGGIISWWLIKKTQFRPHILEKWLSPIHNELKEHKRNLPSLRPVDVKLINEAVTSIESSFFPPNLGGALASYESVCRQYNDILNKLYTRFLDEFKEALIRANVPFQEKHSIAGVSLTLQWLESEPKREESLQQLGPDSGLIAEIPFVGGSSTRYVITHEDCITHAEKIKDLVEDFRRRYQKENLWIEMLRLRDRVLGLNKNIVDVLLKS